MNAIDLHISGDSAGLYALAEWITSNVGNATSELRDELRALGKESNDLWVGLAGEAFRDTVGAFRDCAEPTETYAFDVAEVLRAYASRIRRGKEDFHRWAKEAKDGGLAVSDRWVTMPVPVSSSVGGSGATLWDRDAFARKQKLLEDIGTKVGEWWASLALWVDEHFGKLLGRAGELDPLASRYDALRQGNALTRGAALSIYSENLKQKLLEFEEAAARARERADSHTSRRNSAAPAVKAAALAEAKPELFAARDALDAEVRKLRFASRALPAVGFTVDVAAAGIDVVNGRSISSNTIGISLGLGGGSASIALTAGVIAGVGVTGVGVPIALAMAGALGAQTVGNLATDIYETTTTLDWRETIDPGDWGYVFEHNTDKATRSKN